MTQPNKKEIDNKSLLATQADVETNDITPLERKLLNDSGINESVDDDDEILEEAQLDDTDVDGEMLNEKTDLTGSDLDVPNGEADDDDENIGEEDEENNSYSLSKQDNELENDE